ncbi:hypothetical protein N7510_005992 [Penicillium lagena]|uniref:uncharacterized protein n=1 Tax=Penicillium lagena TaxID=94218 RepID=UPI00254029D8|nr:uncharacterized protein N7510_005992 [Penicillium lagena]KAJ5612798.1 hypothetical protein N7510_005992 [Penicillium lagena]
MAAVFIPPSPQPTLNMSTRRPLANVPNATNSPHRSGLVPAKRARPTQIEIPYGQPPPKKQVTETDARSPTRTKSISTAYQGADSRQLFAARRSNNATPSAFEKKLVAARDKDRPPQTKAAKTEKPSAETLDTIRQWQRHYRKAFPQFVFYFDSIPEDVRRKCSRQVTALGAQEEKFFSRLVTHVITSRPIPPEAANTSPTELEAELVNGDGHMQTVNPSLLEKNGDLHLHASLKSDTRREQSNMDILQRARQMGMKIWALEKLQRMIATINDSEIGGQHDSAARGKAAGGSTAHGKGDNDLSRVLRQEMLNGPSDRDPLSSMEMIMFKGSFIYIHDMNEKTKPVMVKEYPRVPRRQDGIWPQFRSAPLGKCPFIDEPPSRKDYDSHRIREHKEKKAAMRKTQESRGTRETKAAAPEGAAGSKAKDMAKPDTSESQGRRISPPIQAEIPAKLSLDGHERKSSESFIPPHFPRTGPFYTGREPAASGVQPSNITSAIRSQMISSTAAGPGAKAGLSKEVHGLQRKVLEKGAGGPPTGSMAAPQRHVDGSTTQPASQGKSIQQGKSGYTNEKEATRTEGNGAKRPREERRNSQQPQQKKPERKRDPKPGYCENCRDKFDDFEEHTLTRKHRRFAANSTNWAELDALLFDIQRPLKEEYRFDD